VKGGQHFGLELEERRRRGGARRAHARSCRGTSPSRCGPRLAAKGGRRGRSSR
jgi:hypothetical protein